MLSWQADGSPVKHDDAFHISSFSVLFNKRVQLIHYRVPSLCRPDVAAWCDIAIFDGNDHFPFINSLKKSADVDILQIVFVPLKFGDTQDYEL
jgi:hypothetical protein